MFLIIGAIANAIRGGQLWRWVRILTENLPKKFRKKHKVRLETFVKLVKKYTPHDFINALVFALCVYHVTNNEHLAAFSFVAMWVGAAPGWGAYIGAVMGKPKSSEQAWIDRIIAPLSGVKWGIAGLTLRGLFWGAMIAIPFTIYGYLIPAIMFLALGSTMGLVCWLTTLTVRKLGKDGYEWATGEWVFGAVLYSVLYFS